MLLPRDETTDRLEFVDEYGTPVGNVNRPKDPRPFRHSRPGRLTRRTVLPGRSPA